MTSSRSSGFDVGLREPAVGVDVRPLRAGDRPRLEQLLRASHTFTPEEVETALEVIDDTLRGDPDYFVNLLESGGEIAGYECHGPAPLTVGTFDLYWIVVDPGAQKRGYGRVLLAAAEKDIERRGGRLLLIETSSQASYEATTRFYKRAGYRQEARIHNFYRPGDDKLIFAKDLASEDVSRRTTSE